MNAHFIPVDSLMALMAPKREEDGLVTCFAKRGVRVLWHFERIRLRLAVSEAGTDFVAVVLIDNIVRSTVQRACKPLGPSSLPELLLSRRVEVSLSIDVVRDRSFDLLRLVEVTRQGLTLEVRAFSDSHLTSGDQSRALCHL